MQEFAGGCLCEKTTYIAVGEPINAHLCSCTMCQKSGAPTVAWVEFSLASFKWGPNKPEQYQSSAKTKRCFCKFCGGLLGTLNEGYPNVCITITTLNDPNSVIPEAKKHSYKESAPSWWAPSLKD